LPDKGRRSHFQGKEEKKYEHAASGRRIIPSVVMLDLEGKVRVGEAARASLVAMPDRVVAAVKRRMGSSEPLPGPLG